MSEKENTKPNTIIEIVPDGDLVLMVGPKETKLRVRSTLLMFFSKAFSVMLGPDCKEGLNMRDRDGSFQLSLPDDNAAALKIFCLIIHYQNKEASRTFPTGDVLVVAVAADKYDCVNALKDEPNSLVSFRGITGALVLTYDGPYVTIYTDECQYIMPWKVFRLLEK
ncbi:hypothetical protein BKA59DRAFT_497538 [Fusarium tricinctum]|uniref:BTB domain-containing protein n=1 Tax=Fusarium tricinctum TaxID=61284 RepID=A0A8K0RMM9_9HYPO|nr:hypothetical protein BKA59DRAFT_497538 [Fusarium tricinctum]